MVVGCCSTGVNSIHAASIIEFLATSNVVPLPTLTRHHLHTVHIGVGWADRVARPKPVGVGGSRAVLPDKRLVHIDVVQADPGVVAADEGGEVVVLGGVLDGGQHRAKRHALVDSVGLGGCPRGNLSKVFIAKINGTILNGSLF